MNPYKELSHLVLDSEANSPEFIDLIWNHIRYSRIQQPIIFESGTYCGTTSLVLAWYLRYFGLGGHIYTADPVDWAVNERIKINGLEDYITFYPTDYLDMLTDLVATQCDFGIIDCTGWNNRLAHLDATIARTNHGGLIFVDDLNQPPHDALISIRAHASLLLTGGRGCAIYQRVGSDTVTT